MFLSFHSVESAMSVFHCYITTSAKEVMFLSMFVCLLAGLHKNYLANFHEIRWKGGTLAIEEPVRFWW